MASIFIFSLIVAIIFTLILIPIKSKQLKKSEKAAKRNIGAEYIGVTVLMWIIIFGYYYLSNMDRTISSLWLPLLIVTALGAVFASKREQLFKGVLFLASFAFMVYILSAFLFNADEKYTVSKMEEKVEIKAFDETKTPASVPPKFARNKMKKAFGQVPNTSYYELGELQIQKIGEEFVYIAPVEFSGLFKWWNGKTTPGYFKMSATDASNNPKFVKAEMTYTPSAYLNKNLERFIRNQNPDLIFYGDPRLEIDDDGKPFYVRTYGHFISARNGFEMQGVVMVDPANGKTKKYSLDQVPAFIDGAVSPEAVSLQNSYFGKYVHGLWNSFFGKRDVKLPSDEGTVANVSPIFNEKGEMVYFTDFTSPKEGVDSMLGYSLTDARSGKATYYTGNLEESYMDSQAALQIIDKKFIEKKWSGEMPVLYNFYGEASWLTPVLDSNGFLQNYFIVSAANPEISVFANTPNEALKLYKTALQRGGSSVDGTSNAEEKSVSGTILRVFKEKAGDFTVISFYLDNKQNYIVSSENSPLAIYLETGDKVNVKYLDTGEIFMPVKDLNIDGLQ
ncbi:MFS transporter [Lederbergia lenta]|uniref:Uncharacterized protein n=1 Tax=Lederbergia lenta TaxID=1467 RepID=A0A2X4YIF7_LEDLE|nr:hypothetical protein [Lederbergia lenta]MCM3112689.1 hypothetical protein [Lederbergia lenta]MEC2323728.1 hypothetical protein [Lederbergia lenta]SQI51555.1 Uncharacterised protein [Lederbergia lenta]